MNSGLRPPSASCYCCCCWFVVLGFYCYCLIYIILLFLLISKFYSIIMNTLLVLSFRVQIILILVYVMRLSLLFVQSIVLSLDLHLLVGIARNWVSGVSLLFRENWVVIECDSLLEMDTAIWWGIHVHCSYMMFDKMTQTHTSKLDCIYHIVDFV